MTELQKNTVNTVEFASCQESFLPQKSESDLHTYTAETGQLTHESLNVNPDTLTNGGVSVSVILSVAFLVRSFALLISAVNDNDPQ